MGKPPLAIPEPIKQELQKFEIWLKANPKVNSNNTTSAYLRTIRSYLMYLNGRETTQQIIDEYAAKLRSELSHNTLVPYFMALKNYVMKFRKMNIDVPVVSPKAPVTRDKTALTRDEVKKILDAAKENDPMMYAMLSIYYYCGLRLREGADLLLQDIDYGRSQITVRSGKGGYRRVVPITKPGLEAIRAYLPFRNKPKPGYENLLFVSPTGKPTKSDWIRDCLAKIVGIAGIKRRVYTHLFRITCITHLDESGLSVREIQNISGHHTIDTLMGYINSSPERIRLAYNRAMDEGEAKKAELIPPENGMSGEYAKRLITEKYLKGEIDRKAMDSLLSMYERPENIIQKPLDPAFG